MYILYKIVIRLLHIAFKISSFAGNRKIKERNRIMQHKISAYSPDQKTIWVHAASSGEIMTLIPLLEKIQTTLKLPIVFSFFSPSGYHFFKDHSLPDQCLILPLPTETNIVRFIQQINPEICLWIKNEFWLEYFKEIHYKHIPLYWIDVNLKLKYKLFNSLIKSNLYLFNKIFTLNKNLPKSSNVITTNTLKFDSVLPLLLNNYQHVALEKYVKNKPTIILGSCHVSDINLWLAFLRKEPNKVVQINWIIAPHDPEDSTIKSLIQKIPYYTFSSSNFLSNVLYINTIGDLRYLYKYTDGAFIGGGFNKGIHNILEAAIHGIPVCHGFNYTAFPEALTLKEHQLTTPINSINDFSQFIDRVMKNRNRMPQNLLQTHPQLFGNTESIYNEIMNDYQQLASKFLRN